MNRASAFLGLVAASALTVSAADGVGQASHGSAEIEPSVVEAWQRAGAEFRSFDEFDLPGFAFQSGECPSTTILAALPKPRTPFVLQLSAPVTRSGPWAALSEFTELKGIACYNCSGSLLHGLARLPSLDHVAWGTVGELLPEHIQWLASVPKLRALRFRLDQTLSAETVAEIAKMSGLETLSVRFSKITDTGLRAIAGLKKIRWLDLHGTKVTAAGLRVLAGLPELRRLELGPETLSPDAPAELAKLTRLESLSLIYPERWTAAWPAALAALPNLHTLLLDFDYSSGLFDDAALRQLTVLASLQSLELNGTRITDAGLKHLAPLKSLRSLNLHETDITDAGMMALKVLPQLTELVLGNHVSDDGLATLATFPSLRRLKLPDGLAGLQSRHRISSTGIAALMTARPDVRVALQDMTGSAVFDRKLVNETLRMADPDARISMLERVRSRVGRREWGRIDSAILTTLVANHPDRPDRIRVVLDRVMEANPGGTVPETRLRRTLETVGPIADQPALAGRVAELLTASLAGVTDWPMRSSALAMLGRARLAEGRTADAATALDDSLALLTFTRDASPLVQLMAQVSAAQGDPVRALDRYLTAASIAQLTPTQEAQARDLYRRAHGTDEGFDVAITRRYRELFPNPVVADRYVPTPSRSNRLVLVELFTATWCGPCVAADTAFEAVLSRYRDQEVAAVAYHINDPLTVTGNDARRGSYLSWGVPELRIDGGALEGRLRGSSGDLSWAQPGFDVYVTNLDRRLEIPAVGLSLKARGEGDRVTIQSVVKGLPAAARDLRLHVLLVERELHFAGPNRVRQHPMVVRSVAGGNNAGLPIAGDGTMTHVFDLAAIRSDVNATLVIESAKPNAGPLPAAGKGHAAIDTSQLLVVAFVQQGNATDMPNVLQAAQAEVVFTAPKGSGGRFR